MKIKNKLVLKQLINENLKMYPLSQKYFKDIIESLLKSNRSLRELLEIPLIRHTAVSEDIVKNIEKYIQERSFSNIEVPLARLKTNFDDYRPVIFELNAAKLLKDEGMTDITFLSEEGNPDISYKEEDTIRYAEVKSLKDIDPAFAFLDDKLHTMSLLDPSFVKRFFISFEILETFVNVDTYYEKLEKSINELIMQLKGILEKGKLEDEIIQVGDFIFKITTYDEEYNLIYSGRLMKYGSAKDIFMDFSSVYSRYINQIAGGLRQLLKKRSMDYSLVKNDRIYVFLNTGNYANFIPDNLNNIIQQLSEVLGIKDLVEIKTEL